MERDEIKRILVGIKFQLIYLMDKPENELCKKIADYTIGHGYKRIYHFHVRKNGGTSLNKIFCSLGTEQGVNPYGKLSQTRNNRVISNGKVFVGWNQKLIEQGYYYYAFSHTPKHMLKLPDKTFTITCLRDPAERVISHYKMLLEHRLKYKSHPLLKTEGKWLNNSFADFLMNIPRKHLLNQLYMFSKNFSVNEAFDNITECSYFLFLA